MVFTNQFSLENVFLQWVAFFCACVKDFILNCIQNSVDNTAGLSLLFSGTITPAHTILYCSSDFTRAVPNYSS